MSIPGTVVILGDAPLTQALARCYRGTDVLLEPPAPGYPVRALWLLLPEQPSPTLVADLNPAVVNVVSCASPAGEPADLLAAARRWRRFVIPVPGADPAELAGLLYAEAAHPATLGRVTHIGTTAAAAAEPLAANDVRVTGGRLTYLAGGPGTEPVVLLNALGQGLEYWRPLLADLVRRRRVLVWETRTTDDTGRLCTLADQVSDLAAVLSAERARGCHLVGWCTGAKVSVRFADQHPGLARSIVTLSGAFKHPGRDDSLDTDYERDLERLCRALDRTPHRAGALRRFFLAGGPSAGDPRLAGAVTHPFRTDQSTVDYARQHLEFWSHDVSAALSRLSVPTLFAAGEADAIVGSEGIRRAAARCPAGTFLLMPGATHYRMYDRPDLIADLIEHFPP
jgi:pimeloyl-ACP methyl ester carboxylesterase